jgi:hypothetical protein
METSLVLPTLTPKKSRNMSRIFLGGIFFFTAVLRNVHSGDDPINRPVTARAEELRKLFDGLNSTLSILRSALCADLRMDKVPFNC